MANYAAQLTLYCYGPAQQRSELAYGLGRNCGFHENVTEGSEMELDESSYYMTEPFEDRAENVDALDRCVTVLSEEFTEMEVWLQDKRNKDHGNPVSQDYLLFVAPDREFVE